MPEILRCPGCAVTYGLRAERVSPALHRARCCRCGEVFDIREPVIRLLGLEAAAVPVMALPDLGFPGDVTVELGPLDPPTSPEAWTGAPMEDITAGSLPPLDAFDLPEIDTPVLAPAMEAAPSCPDVELPALPETPDLEAAVSLPDTFPAFDAALLEGLPEPDPAQAPLVMDEALETVETLSSFSIPEAAFAPADIIPVYHPEPSPTDTLQSLPPMDDPAPTLSIMDLESSDEDILDRTIITQGLPESPAAATVPAAPVTEGEGFHSAKDAISKLLGGLEAPNRDAGRAGTRPLDMDAAMTALDGTLGASPSASPNLGQSQGAGTATTQRLTMEDLQAALKGAPRQGAALPPPPPSSVLPPASPAYSTVASFPGPDGTTQDPYLLKIRVGNDLYENLSVERLSEWILQGRVLESFPVARQHSENWIEAVRVPALRPIFEKARKHLGEPALPPEPGVTPQKRGLFGGLFGRG